MRIALILKLHVMFYAPMELTSSKAALIPKNTIGVITAPARTDSNFATNVIICLLVVTPASSLIQTSPQRLLHLHIAVDVYVHGCRGCYGHGGMACDFCVGVILVQLIEPRLLKVEVFPDKMLSEVFGFTGDAKLYE